VGSAPCYPFGVIDPITDIAALALDRGLLCHVDACLFVGVGLTAATTFTQLLLADDPRSVRAHIPEEEL
jgi:hypothetical protein